MSKEIRILKILKLNIRNISNLEKIFKHYKKYKFNNSLSFAQPSHDYGKDHPKIDFDVNASGALNLLELTKNIAQTHHLSLCQQIKFMGIIQINFL